MQEKLPDIFPWLDNESDIYDELPVQEEFPYDEQFMLDLNNYIQKVIWYVSEEYCFEKITVEQFFQIPHSNIIFDFVYNNYVKEVPFQNCACELVNYLNKLASK